MNICWILLILLAVEYLFAFDKYMTVKIDNVLLDSLTAQAKVSPRLRMNYDLLNSATNSDVQEADLKLHEGSAISSGPICTTSYEVVNEYHYYILSGFTGQPWSGLRSLY